MRETISKPGSDSRFKTPNDQPENRIERRLLSVKQAAFYLNVSPDTIYREKDSIGYVKIRGKILFKKDSLDIYIDNNTHSEGL